MDSKSAGAIYGVATYTAGYLLTFVLKAGASRQWLSVVSGSLPSEPSVWKVIGWVYYRMHGVNIAISVSGNTQSRTLSVDPTVGPNPVWDQWLLVVPPLVLLGAGYLLARNQSVPTGERGAKVGVLVTIGYLPAAVMGALAAQWAFHLDRLGQTVSVVAGPDIVAAVLFAGVVYPLLAGGIGGFVYGSTAGATPPGRDPAHARQSYGGYSGHGRGAGDPGGQRGQPTGKAGPRSGGQSSHGRQHPDRRGPQTPPEGTDPARAHQSGSGHRRTHRADEAGQGRRSGGAGGTRRPATPRSAGGAFGRQYAGFGSRTLAFAIDYTLTAFTAGLYWLYWLYRTATRGDSIGKSAAGIVVVTRDGSRDLGLGTALVREVVGRTVDFVLFVVGGLLWILIDDDNQAIHDKIAGTYVVEGTAVEDPPETTGATAETAGPNPESAGTASATDRAQQSMGRLGWFSLLLALVTGVFALALLYLSRVGYQEGALYVRETYYYTATVGGSRHVVPLSYVYGGLTAVFVLLGIGALRRWPGVWVACVGWYALVLLGALYPPPTVPAVPLAALGMYWAVRGRTAAPLSAGGADADSEPHGGADADSEQPG